MLHRGHGETLSHHALYMDKALYMYKAADDDKELELDYDETQRYSSHDRRGCQLGNKTSGLEMLLIPLYHLIDVRHKT